MYTIESAHNSASGGNRSGYARKRNATPVKMGDSMTNLFSTIHETI